MCVEWKEAPLEIVDYIVDQICEGDKATVAFYRKTDAINYLWTGIMVLSGEAKFEGMYYPRGAKKRWKQTGEWDFKAQDEIQRSTLRELRLHESDSKFFRLSPRGDGVQTTMAYVSGDCIYILWRYMFLRIRLKGEVDFLLKFGGRHMLRGQYDGRVIVKQTRIPLYHLVCFSLQYSGYANGAGTFRRYIEHLYGEVVRREEICEGMTAFCGFKEGMYRVVFVTLNDHFALPEHDFPDFEYEIVDQESITVRIGEDSYDVTISRDPSEEDD